MPNHITDTIKKFVDVAKYRSGELWFDFYL